MISTINSNSNRISGLASGMDTEELVKQLTKTTTTKIEKAEQQKQLLEWKQEYYREISTKLVAFNEKYFGSSSSSMLFGDTLTRLTATSSDTKYVTATAVAGANAGKVEIYDIKRLASAAKYQSAGPVSPPLAFAVDTARLDSLAGKSMKITLDGLTKTVTFGAGPYADSDDVAAALQGLVNGAFGEGRVSVSGEGGSLSLSAANSFLSIANTGVEANEALTVLGFTAGDPFSNRLDFSAGISTYPALCAPDGTVSFSINDVSFTFSGTASLNQIMSAVNSSAAGVNMSYSSVNDTFTLTSKETGSGANIAWEDGEGSFMSAIMGGSGLYTAGVDAEVELSVNGADPVTLIRSSNTFTLEGVTYTLNAMAEGTGEEKVTVNIAADTDKLVENIKQFVADYNELLGSITDKINEEYDRSYMPLTESEKENLSEKEIETLTNKAKTGLLRNDSYLTDIATALRTSLYKEVKKTDGSEGNLAYILADIGITTSTYKENGKLKIDEERLRSVLAKDPAGVMGLFTQKSSVGFSLYNTPENAKKRTEESGLLWRLSDIIKTNISNVGKKGALIQLAGSPTTGFIGETTYSKKLYDINNTISTLKSKLMKEEDFYWSKFTAMESSLNSLNAQSAWITQQFSAQ